MDERLTETKFVDVDGVEHVAVSLSSRGWDYHVHAVMVTLASCEVSPKEEARVKRDCLGPRPAAGWSGPIRIHGLMTLIEVDAVLNNPATSFWLADAVAGSSLRARSIDDALNDAEVLVEILKSRKHYGRFGTGEEIEDPAYD